jgi:hypothetical protein
MLQLKSFKACCADRVALGEQLYAVTLTSSVDNGAYTLGDNYRFALLRIKEGQWAVITVATEPGPMPEYTPRASSSPAR